MELTEQERKFAEFSAKRYHSLLNQKSQLIGWIGVALFGLGVLQLIPMSVSTQKLFLRAGFILIVMSIILFAMTIIGKLYIRNQELNRKRMD
ncbi:MAG: hypothetical protein M0R70_13355 [Nitrospirae bacterium]|nr:hypothetical protein [Nitrospirota bacterium]